MDQRGDEDNRDERKQADPDVVPEVSAEDAGPHLPGSVRVTKRARQRLRPRQKKERCGAKQDRNATAPLDAAPQDDAQMRKGTPLALTLSCGLISAPT